MTRQELVEILNETLQRFSDAEHEVDSLRELCRRAYGVIECYREHNRPDAKDVHDLMMLLNPEAEEASDEFLADLKESMKGRKDGDK